MKKVFALVALAGFFAVSCGNQESGEAKEVEKEMDEKFEEAVEEMEETMEEAGDKAEEMGEEAADKAEELGEEAEEMMEGDEDHKGHDH